MAKTSKYPKAIRPDLVGTYPALTKSGGGFFYDEVLEYRVWVHPGDGDDVFCSFEDFESALEFATKTEHAEEPLVLVRQDEHVNEPVPGKYVHVKEERITEWQTVWLANNKRKPGLIEAMVAKSK